MLYPARTVAPKANVNLIDMVAAIVRAPLPLPLLMSPNKAVKSNSSLLGYGISTRITNKPITDARPNEYASNRFVQHNVLTDTDLD